MDDELRIGGANNNNNTTAANEPIPQIPYHSTLTDSEREVLQQQLHQSRQKMYQKCNIQCFLMILLLLFVCKCNGATFTSFFILSPFLLLVRVPMNTLKYIQSNCHSTFISTILILLVLHSLFSSSGQFNSLLHRMCHFWCNGSAQRWHPFSRRCRSKE